MPLTMPGKEGSGGTIGGLTKLVLQGAKEELTTTVAYSEPSGSVGSVGGGVHLEVGVKVVLQGLRKNEKFNSQIAVIIEQPDVKNMILVSTLDELVHLRIRRSHYRAATPEELKATAAHTHSSTSSSSATSHSSFDKPRSDPVDQPDVLHIPDTPYTIVRTAQAKMEIIKDSEPHKRICQDTHYVTKDKIYSKQRGDDPELLVIPNTTSTLAKFTAMCENSCIPIRDSEVDCGEGIALKENGREMVWVVDGDRVADVVRELDFDRNEMVLRGGGMEIDVRRLEKYHKWALDVTELCEATGVTHNIPLPRACEVGKYTLRIDRGTNNKARLGIYAGDAFQQFITKAAYDAASRRVSPDSFTEFSHNDAVQLPEENLNGVLADLVALCEAAEVPHDIVLPPLPVEPPTPPSLPTIREERPSGVFVLVKSSPTASNLGFEVNDTTLRITKVAPGTAAAVAGLPVGSKIITVQNRKINELGDIHRALDTRELEIEIRCATVEVVEEVVEEPVKRSERETALERQLEEARKEIEMLRNPPPTPVTAPPGTPLGSVLDTPCNSTFNPEEEIKHYTTVDVILHTPGAAEKRITLQNMGKPYPELLRYLESTPPPVDPVQFWVSTSVAALKAGVVFKAAEEWNSTPVYEGDGIFLFVNDSGKWTVSCKREHMKRSTGWVKAKKRGPPHSGPHEVSAWVSNDGRQWTDEPSVEVVPLHKILVAKDSPPTQWAPYVFGDIIPSGGSIWVGDGDPGGARKRPGPAPWPAPQSRPQRATSPANSAAPFARPPSTFFSTSHEPPPPPTSGGGYSSLPVPNWDVPPIPDEVPYVRGAHSLQRRLSPLRPKR